MLEDNVCIVLLLIYLSLKWQQFFTCIAISISLIKALYLTNSKEYSCKVLAYPYMPQHFTLLWLIILTASDTCDGMIAGCSSTSGSPGRGHERSLSDGGQTGIIKEGIDVIGERRLAATAVKNIISTFWSSSANLMVEVSVFSFF